MNTNTNTIHITYAHTPDAGITQTIDTNNTLAIERALLSVDTFDVETVIYVDRGDDIVEMRSTVGPYAGDVACVSTDAPLDDIKYALINVGLVMTWGDDLPPHTRGIAFSDCPEWRTWCADHNADWFND